MLSDEVCEHSCSSSMLFTKQMQRPGVDCQGGNVLFTACVGGIAGLTWSGHLTITHFPVNTCIKTSMLLPFWYLPIQSLQLIIIPSQPKIPPHWPLTLAYFWAPFARYFLSLGWTNYNGSIDRCEIPHVLHSGALNRKNKKKNWKFEPSPVTCCRKCHCKINRFLHHSPQRHSLLVMTGCILLYMPYHLALCRRPGGMLSFDFVLIGSSRNLSGSLFWLSLDLFPNPISLPLTVNRAQCLQTYAACRHELVSQIIHAPATLRCSSFGLDCDWFDWLPGDQMKAQHHNSIKLGPGQRTARLWPFSPFHHNQNLTSNICLLYPDSSAMGVKMLQCFPFYRRCKERCKSKQCPPVAGKRNYRQITKRVGTIWD